MLQTNNLASGNGFCLKRNQFLRCHIACTVSLKMYFHLPYISVCNFMLYWIHNREFSVLHSIVCTIVGMRRGHTCCGILQSLTTCSVVSISSPQISHVASSMMFPLHSNNLVFNLSWQINQSKKDPRVDPFSFQILFHGFAFVVPPPICLKSS